MSNIRIYKHDHHGIEQWHYDGVVISRSDTQLEVVAYFNRPDRELGYTVFRFKDRFIEWFYTDRWYNIFEVHDVNDDRLKGWYCNITRPAHFTSDTIRGDDLALDVWVDPTGRVLVLDEDEFAGLDLDEATREGALAGLRDLQDRVARREFPFNRIQIQ
jgi:protein associated with RNAse G/E